MVSHRRDRGCGNRVEPIVAPTTKRMPGTNRPKTMRSLGSHTEGACPVAAPQPYVASYSIRCVRRDRIAKYPRHGGA